MTDYKELAKSEPIFSLKLFAFNSTFQLEYCMCFKIFINLVSYHLHYLQATEGQ